MTAAEKDARINAMETEVERLDRVRVALMREIVQLYSEMNQTLHVMVGKLPNAES
jgi:hypothetical protein